MATELNLDELVQDQRVHRRVYLEPEIFDLEMERIFERSWIYIGHDSEVAHPGDYKAVRFGTQPAILTRDEDGQLHVVMNRCMHRGASICQESRGNASYFRCWYHGWTYSNKGELIGTPYAGGYGKNFDKLRFALVKAARVESYRGLVFASLSSEVPRLSDHLGAAKYYIDLFMDLSPEGAVEARCGTHKYGYDANWKFQMENGVDGYHANFVHQAFFEAQERKSGARVMRMFTEQSEFETRDLGNGHSILDMAPRKRAPDRPLRNVLRGSTTQASTDAYMEGLLRRYGKERTSEILAASNVNLAVFPNLLIIGVQFRTVIPVSANRTEVFLAPTTLKGVPEEINVARLRAHEAFYGPAGAGAPDDIEMFNRCAEGLKVKAAEWMELSRGLERERVTPDGFTVAHLTDEVPQRAFYHQWKSMMCGWRSAESTAAAGS
jgi:phenylpropionate dioxygenase-like ring-hydroxylating dioxygenase large terminal subunit